MACSVVLLLIATVIGCTYADGLESVVASNLQFTANTYKEVAKISGNENIILSGLSAEIVLALLANGAVGNTRKQLTNGLSLPANLEKVNHAINEISTGLSINNDELKLLSANKIYPATGFPISQQFKDLAVNSYKAGVENVNYANPGLAAQTINHWVEEHTNNRIQNLLSPNQLSADTVLVLVNALFLKASWESPFEKYFSKKRTFHVSSTETKEIDSMHTEAWANYYYNKELQAAFLDLPFRGGNISMTFVLPDAHLGLTAVEKDIEKYLAPQKLRNARVAITLPKFTINTKIDFKPILNSLGVTDIFSDAADLSGISNAAPLKVDFVLQKAFIDVNEDGVEAAAATAVGVVGLSFMVPEPVRYTFEADRPFLFYIKDKKYKTKLFAGRFMG